jgi:hypothetical protein
MSVAVSGDGGTKKSPLLVPLPKAVVTETRPEPVPVGTVADIDVLLDELIAPRLILNLRSFLLGVGSKLVPLTVTAVPGVPTVGVKPLTVGKPFVEGDVTMNELALDDDPDGALIPIGPVVAPEGTTATSCVGAAETTVAGVPLNVTVFWLGVALKPVPKIVTEVPTSPLPGVNSMSDAWEEL